MLRKGIEWNASREAAFGIGSMTYKLENKTG